jgi:hypothetical protein
MIQKLFLVTIVLTLGISAVASCGIVETPSKTELRTANVPPVNASAQEPEGTQPPIDTWRHPTPAEAIETKLALESADFPQRDLIDLTLRPGQPIP